MITAPETGLEWRHDRVVLPCILVFAALLSIKYFTGLENDAYYAGFTMSAIHPELLNADPIVGNKAIGASSPYLLTITHLFPKVLGELWLDDRVVAVVYLIFVALAFLAVDRIAVALGACGLWERLIILMLFLRDHMILENSVNLAHHPDFNHSAMAIPIALWLIWSVVRGKSLIVVLALSALLVSTSLLVAPYTVGLALVAVALTGHGNERVIAASLVAAGVMAAVYVLFYHLQVPASDRLGLWDILVNHLYESMVAPFDPQFLGTAFVVLGSTVFAGAFAIVLFWPAPANHGLAAARAIIGTAALGWIVLGLYGQYAPDWARYPQLLMLPITRQLQYPQILAFIGAFVIMLRWAGPRPEPGRALIAGLVMSVLVVAGPGNLDLWTGLFSAALMGSIVLYAAPRMRPRESGGAITGVAMNFRPVFGTALALTMAVALGYAATQRTADFAFLLDTGIHGRSNNAAWVGVDAWVRANTPEDAVILPLRHDTSGRYPARESGDPFLKVDRGLASRSGRAVPKPNIVSRGLDLKHFRFARRQQGIAIALARAWMDLDVPALAGHIETLDPKPDYVIAPTVDAERVAGPGFPFAPVAKVRGYTIMRRGY